VSRQFLREVWAVVSVGEQSVEIRNLRVAFQITKDDLPWPAVNTAQVRIWGLATTTQEVTRQRNAIIQVYGGYEGNTGLLFLGAITHSVTERDGSEVVTVIESNKPVPLVFNISRTLTLQGRLGLHDILRQAAAGYGPDVTVDLGGVEDVDVSQLYPRGVVLDGEPGPVLNRLTRANLVDWTLEDGVVRVLRRAESTSEPAIILSPRTGLVGSPVPMQYGSGSLVRAAIEATSLLNHEIRIRRIVAIADTQDLQGWYLVRRITMSGDSGWANDFYSRVEATPIRPR
jgi:hypothetical protein